MEAKKILSTIGTGVKDFIVFTGPIVALGLVAYFENKNRIYLDEKVYDVERNKFVGYSDVVMAIMESDMYDSKKSDAVTILCKDGDSEYYEAVLSIIKSDMYDSKKVNLIETLS